jgi:hypothetical protein
VGVEKVTVINRLNGSKIVVKEVKDGHHRVIKP